MELKDHMNTALKACLDNILPLIILTLLLCAVSVITLGILAPVAFAGYTYALNRLLAENREPRAQDIFSQLRLFFPLLGFSILVIIVTAIGFTLFILPGIIFAVIISYFCLYLIPLMVDKQFGLIDSIKKSISMVTTSHQFVDHLVVFLIFYALTTIGGSSFIGFLVLQPFATLFLLSVYRKTC